MKHNLELVAAAIHVAENCKTLYVLGCFGAPMNKSNRTRYSSNYAFNAKVDRMEKILAAGEDTFGFDCVCFIKALLWDWSGDTSKTYGGAQYVSNGVPDVSANGMIKRCLEVSTDFSQILPGEILWIDGHVAIYIGDGKAVECTHRWKDGVQITAVHNLGKKSGYQGRVWTKHGKLPWITYLLQSGGENDLDEAITVLAKAVLRGDFGNGQVRKDAIYQAVQNKVNQLCKEEEA